MFAVELGEEDAVPDEDTVQEKHSVFISSFELHFPHGSLQSFLFGASWTENFIQLNHKIDPEALTVFCSMMSLIKHSEQYFQ